MADVPGEKMNLYNTHFLKPVHFEWRIKRTQVVRPPAAQREHGAAGRA